MRHQQETLERVRSLMGPGNPVPQDTPAGRWPDADAQETRDWIMAVAHPDAGQTPPGPAGSGPDRPRRRPRNGNGRTWRVIGPVAAGLAVVGLITGLTLAGRTPGRRPAAGAPAAADRGLPKFYVTLSSVGDGRDTLTAEVHSSVTGRVLSHRTVGALGNGIGITADRSDRAFVIDATIGTPRGPAVGLELLRVAANGRSTTLRRLPVILAAPRSPNVVEGIAVSPDGTKLAAALVVIQKGDIRKPHAEIVVSSLAGGATRTWTAPRHVALAFNPVWTNGSRQLTFVWQDRLQGNPGVFYTGRSQVRVLDTAAAGHSLLAARAIATGGGQLGFIQSALAGPGDSPVIAATFRNVPGTGASGTAIVALTGLSPAGAVTRVFARHAIAYRSQAQMITADTNCQVLGMDATGQHTIAYCPDFGRIDHGRFTPLRHNPGVFAAAW
jgi:hypothetical protein